MSQPVLLLAGPTGVGKSEVALKLAKLWGAEIVSADARQMYRGLDVGTAKPTAQDRLEVPHHLLDLLDPPERYSAARFLADSKRVLEGITSEGKRAIVVGGTGLYLRALREGLFDAPETTPEVRFRVDEILERGGRQALEDYLVKLDPDTLAVVDRNNPARLRRAVEYHLMTQESLAAAQQSGKNEAAPFDFYPVVLVRPRLQLNERIVLRTRNMLEHGWLDEVKRLSEAWDFALPAFDAVGYRELYDVVNKRLRLDQAEQAIVMRTKQYAKRQVTWFTHQGQWLWVSPDDEVTSKITSGLSTFAENKSA